MTIRTDRSSLLWAPETTFGIVPSTNYQRFGLHDSATLPDPEYSWNPYYSFNTTHRAHIFRGQEKLEGDIPNIRVIGANFLNFLTSPDGFTIPSFSLAAGMYDTAGALNFTRLYAGGKVNRATISIREGEELTYSIDNMMFVQTYHNRPNGAAARFSNFFPIDPGPLNTERYFFEQVSIAMAGVVMGRVRAATITIDNGLLPYYALQSGPTFDQIQSPLKLFTGSTSYSISITVDMVDNSDLTFWDFLSNQISNPSDAPVLGNGISLVCQRLLEPAGSSPVLIITCGVGSPNRGLVFSKVDYPMSVSDRGYYTATFTGNFDILTIQES